MPFAAPRLPVLLSFRQALRNFRMSVFASTPFIGPPENNFSHKFKNRFRPRLSLSDSSCLSPAQLLSQCASIAVRMHFNYLSRFDAPPGRKAAHRAYLKAFECSSLDSRPALFPRKKRRQEDRPLPPSVSIKP
jgi:hypothetical protein